ncbi:MAG: hypothetical protein HUJ98_01490 [Bacteroidaceae bacterium]|nr:hypothetical protein [Bacteroidaceae bacterium]
MKKTVKPFKTYLAEHLSKAEMQNTSLCFKVVVANLMWEKIQCYSVDPAMCFAAWDIYCKEHNIYFDRKDVEGVLNSLDCIIEKQQSEGKNGFCIILSDAGFKMLKQIYK